jgi:hypothetical protein
MKRVGSPREVVEHLGRRKERNLALAAVFGVPIEPSVLRERLTHR